LRLPEAKSLASRNAALEWRLAEFCLRLVDYNRQKIIEKPIPSA
jgi:hypothetical protein